MQTKLPLAVAAAATFYYYYSRPSTRDSAREFAEYMKRKAAPSPASADTEKKTKLLKSWVDVSAENHFPIQNLPYGMFKSGNNQTPHIATAIGDMVVDLNVLANADLLKGQHLGGGECFKESTLNTFMALGRSAWTEARNILTALLSEDCGVIRDNKELRDRALLAQSSVTMVLPCRIGDYTDFYSSRYHATNVGKMFRPGQAALKPNWTHLPVGYHGRASSVVISGTDLIRPKGQLCPNLEAAPPVHSKCRLLDFELEMALFVGPGNKLGHPISMEDAEDHIFGLVVMNDWSARDIQKFEYIPLGPFGGKNFGTTVSPWIVTLDALESFKIPNQKQEPTPLPYLQDTSKAGLHTYDLKLTVELSGDDLKETHLISTSNAKYLYWNYKQQLVHHSVTGCNMRPGDLLGSGTISGPDKSEYGSMLELCWKGTTPLDLETGVQRKFLKDGDTVTMSGYCQGDGYRVGFGECSGKILPAL